MQVITDAESLKGYLGKSDGGYFVEQKGLHREVGGEICKRLGLSDPDFKKFFPLVEGFDPNTGEQLTARLAENRIPGWHLTASVPKGVTIALENGDDRIHDVLWESVRETIADIAKLTTTRVRKGGKEEDRITGNLGYYAEEHAETRPAKADNMADPDRHIHIIIPNLTYDPIENEIKAIKFRPIMDLRKYFDRSFDLRLSTKLAELGYEIETKYKPDEKGGKRYFSWDVKGIPDSVTKKFSRRSAEVEKLADELGVRTPVGKDTLGATSRANKRKDLTLDDLREYWRSRITPEEAKQIASTLLAAMSGKNGPREEKAPQAVAYALEHEFERRSVVDWHDLAVTAMERAMGGAKPEEVLPEAKRQGLLLKDGLATTRDVLAQEGRVVAWAREGRGTCRPFRVGGKGNEALLEGLSEQQAAVARHIWGSTDRVMAIRGGAGTGKTHSMKLTIAGIDRPTVVLAPSSDASRGVLRKEGFKEADTLAKFLLDEQFQQKARNGVIWVDEAGQVSMRQLDQLFKVADKLDARIVLQGDKRQHGAIERGATLRVLEEFAGLPVAELTDIRRQKGDYKAAVASIQKGDILGGYDKLASMGWVQQTPVFDHNKPLVDDFLAALENRKTALVIAPTHAEGDEIAEEIRTRLKAAGRVGADERVFDRLVPLHWTEAEKNDRDRYDGSEVVQFVRNAGPYRIGQRIDGATYRDQVLAPRDDGAGRKAGRGKPRAGGRASDDRRVAVFAPGQISLAPGDRIRITSGGKSKDGHRLDAGAVYTVGGFRETDRGTDLVLSNGWVLDGSHALHVAHAYVSTSHAAQGKTVDQVLIAMGGESRRAINAEQFYVSVSRGKESARIYTSLSPATLREAIQRNDQRMTATELMKPKRKERVKEFWRKVQRTYRRLRERDHETTKDQTREREHVHER